MAKPRKYKSSQVREWRRQYELRLQSKSISQLAREAGMHTSHMHQIVTGRLYKNV